MRFRFSRKVRLRAKHEVKIWLFTFINNHINPWFQQQYFEIDFKNLQDKLLGCSRGVLHIGASTGQEASNYNLFNLRVLWVEAVPDIYNLLRDNIANFPTQKAICALLGSKHDEVEFIIMNNAGESSSIFTMPKKKMEELGIREESRMKIQMMTLDSLFTQNDLSEFNYWVLDVQGAELEVLKGALNSLTNCKFLEIEVSTQMQYEGAPLFAELAEFLRSKGFIHLLTPSTKEFHGNVLFMKVH
jgi:FkbM family methyltransferase